MNSLSSGEKPFSCEDCNDSFKWKYQLNEHKSAAHGLKLFRCVFCPKGKNSKMSKSAKDGKIKPISIFLHQHFEYGLRFHKN